MKKETYEFTDEQITKMNYYDRRAALIAELKILSKTEKPMITTTLI